MKEIKQRTKRDSNGRRRDKKEEKGKDGSEGEVNLWELPLSTRCIPSVCRARMRLATLLLAMI